MVVNIETVKCKTKASKDRQYEVTVTEPTGG
jgi:hypothetical protein